ncbi:hypothetical protein LVJ94_28350 [Pendulispora rubella]|uniref:Secreted protein n=1 Tax=Pendulispora rubella TaxID=2741070 RepID=A0ABZ2KUY0_9BACT
MKRHFFLAFGVLASLAAFPACSSDDDDDKGTATVVETLTMDCSVETFAGPEMDYHVVDNKLVLLQSGQRSEMTRSGTASGDKPIHGTWQMPPFEVAGDPDYVAKHQVRTIGTIRIEDGRVTLTANCSSLEHSMSVSASSPATITDTTIRVLESHKEAKHWSSRTGESTVAKTSIDTLAVQPQLGEGALASGAVVFPFAAY